MWKARSNSKFKCTVLVDDMTSPVINLRIIFGEWLHVLIHFNLFVFANTTTGLLNRHTPFSLENVG